MGNSLTIEEVEYIPVILEKIKLKYNALSSQVYSMPYSYAFSYLRVNENIADRIFRITKIYADKCITEDFNLGTYSGLFFHLRDFTYWSNVKSILENFYNVHSHIANYWN